MSKPSIPTTTNVSDLIGSMVAFHNDNPLWHENPESLMRMGAAFTILTKMCDPIHLTEEEYQFAMQIFQTCKEQETT